MKEPHLIALGARTPVGLDAASSAAAVRAGISRIRHHPHFVDPAGDPLKCGYDALLDTAQQGVPRMLALARDALEQALSRLKDVSDSEPIAVFLSVPEHRPGFSERDEAELVDSLQQGWQQPLRVQVVERGHAGALHGLGAARAWIEGRRGEVCLVGGVESYLEADTLDWLADTEQLSTQERASWFIPGEAAGFVALGSPSVAARVGSLGIVRGTHSERETSLIRTDAVNLGRALTTCVDRAATCLNLPSETIDDTWCDINGDRYRTDELTYVLLRLPHVFRQEHGAPVGYQTAISSWGDVGAATGALLTILASRSWSRGYASGPRLLLTAGSEGGLRSAAIIQKGD